MLLNYEAKGRSLLGIDGGATKTEFVLFYEDGHVLNRITLEGCNPNVCGIEKSCAILKSGIDAMISDQHSVLGVFAGIAGSMSGCNQQKLYQFFESAYPHMKVTIGSDILNVIFCADKIDRCAVVICGTGFVIYANEYGKLSRVGGWGYLLDDASGGYGLGREALKAVLAYEDGFGEETLLTSPIRKKLGSSVWESIGEIYSGGDRYIASFSPLVFEAYMQHDAIAEKILHTYTDKVVELIKYTLNRYDCNHTVVISGGLLNNEIMLSTLKEKMGNDVKLILPELPQIYGACRRAVTLYGEVSENFEENFKRNIFRR